MKTNLTFKEDNTLHSISNIIEDEWGMVAEINIPASCGINKKSIPGIIGSLAKKGLVECDRDEGIDWIKITESGAECLS